MSETLKDQVAKLRAFTEERAYTPPPMTSSAALATRGPGFSDPRRKAALKAFERAEKSLLLAVQACEAPGRAALLAARKACERAQVDLLGCKQACEVAGLTGPLPVVIDAYAAIGEARFDAAPLGTVRAVLVAIGEQRISVIK